MSSIPTSLGKRNAAGVREVRFPNPEGRTREPRTFGLNVWKTTRATGHSRSVPHIQPMLTIGLIFPTQDLNRPGEARGRGRPLFRPRVWRERTSKPSTGKTRAIG